MSFVLIEHDLDIALRVVDARHRDAQRPRAAHRHARRDRERRAGAGDLHGEQALMAWFGTDRDTHGAAPRRAGAGRRGARRLLRPRPCAAGREPHAGARRARHRRPQRHGQDDAVQRDHRAGAGARQRPAGRRGDPRPARRNEITQRGIAYVPQGRRVWPSLTVDETLRLVAGRRRDVDRVYAMFPRLAERRGQRRRAALRRRAADARDRPRAAARTRSCW